MCSRGLSLRATLNSSQTDRECRGGFSDLGAVTGNDQCFEL